MRTILYKRATFVTHLPASHLYTRSHNWLAQAESKDEWRIGYTKFALRMLGELVDVKFEIQPEKQVRAGDIVGTIEGFKAISDIYCVASGHFVTGNPALEFGLEHVVEKPYDEGWLYRIRGQPDGSAMDVSGYRAFLDATIDRILEKQRQEESMA